MEKTMEKSLSIHDPPEGCIHITVKIFLQLSRDFFVQKMGYIQVVFWCTAVASRHKHRICEVHKKKNVQKKTLLLPLHLSESARVLKVGSQGCINRAFFFR